MAGETRFVGLPLLLLDLAIDWNCEREFVRALLAAAPEALVTIPAGDTRTRNAFSGLSSAEELAPDSSTEDRSLTRLNQYLFSQAVPPKREPDDEVVLFSAPGEERECIEIARLILKEAAAGLRFDQIAVLLRDPRTYISLLETALRRAVIPAYFARGTTRPDPSGRAFLALLTCAGEGLSAKRFAEYLSFGQVPVDGRITPLKTEASRTNLPLPEELMDLLRQWHSITPFNKPDDWVFASPYTKSKRPFWPAQLLKKHIKPVALAAGLPSIGWHSFRHTVSAWGKEAGLKLEDVKTLLRHEDIATTSNVYGDLGMDAKRRIQQRLVAFVNEQAKSLEDVSRIQKAWARMPVSVQ